MNKCYELEKIYFKEALFKSTVISATYVIHLIGNNRLDSVKTQIHEYKITNTNYILYNKGYKNCHKELLENLPRYDLIDAFYTIFKDAKSKKYRYILILEDDFIFDEKIKDKKIINEISNFLNKNINLIDIYALGVLPQIILPYYKNTFYITLSGGTHGMIYSDKFINKTLSIDTYTLYDWDIYTRQNATKFLYKYPLCYQLFPQTENTQNWGDIFGIKYDDIYRPVIKYLELDKKIDGYFIFYNISKLLGILILFICFFILYKSTVFVSKLNYCNNRNH